MHHSPGGRGIALDVGGPEELFNPPDGRSLGIPPANKPPPPPPGGAIGPPPPPPPFFTETTKDREVKQMKFITHKQ